MNESSSSFYLKEFFYTFKNKRREDSYSNMVIFAKGFVSSNPNEEKNVQKLDLLYLAPIKYVLDFGGKITEFNKTNFTLSEYHEFMEKSFTETKARISQNTLRRLKHYKGVDNISLSTLEFFYTIALYGGLMLDEEIKESRNSPFQKNKLFFQDIVNILGFVKMETMEIVGEVSKRHEFNFNSLLNLDREEIAKYKEW
jgi:hypothetical protein